MSGIEMPSCSLIEKPAESGEQLTDRRCASNAESGFLGITPLPMNVTARRSIKIIPTEVSPFLTRFLETAS